MLRMEPILTGDKSARKEKIRWILAIVLSLLAIFLCIQIICTGFKIAESNVTEEESKDVFMMLGRLAGKMLGFIAIFIFGIISFSSAALGAFFAYSFKDNEIKFVKFTCRILFAADILCVIGSVVVICIFL